MLGPRYVLTSYQKKLFDMDYEKHKKRLNTIQGSKRKINEDTDKAFRTTFNDLQSKHQLFQNVEKVSSIDKTNQLLLDKLVKISKNQKPTLFKTQTWSTHPGTLNTNFRKRELEKIAMENESMAKRLISQHGSVNIKRLEVDFDKHRQFGKNVQKVTSPTSISSAKLPVLQSPKSGEGSKKKQKKERRVKTQEDQKEDLGAATQESQDGEAETQGEVQSIPVEKIQIPVENTNQAASHSGNQTNQEIKEEVIAGTNQTSQRTNKDEISSNIKSSGELEEGENKEETAAGEKVEKAGGKKEAERPAKRSGTMQYSNKFLGDNSNKEATRRTSTHMPRKPSTLRADKSESNIQNKSVENAEEKKSSRKDTESQPPKSERQQEEKMESTTPRQTSNRGEEGNQEEVPPVVEAQELAPVQEGTEEERGEKEANQ